MDRLCDEILQLIFFELNDPSSLVVVSKRFYEFSQDPYVRARYFLTRYGPIQAMFWALGRGKLMSTNVLDILISSGAQFSRYLIQVATHHYFRTTAHFVKSAWVRSVPFPVFAYFLKLAADKYGEIPCGKGEDDGTIFLTFLKESRLPPLMKNITWEDISDILVEYHFIPFCHKDPIMAQFPLALAVEPRLLPLATANGFRMDKKHRDFVFRKMFERPSVGNDNRTDEIIHNVRELCRLDPSMFLSRTVAAEVCMEARINDQAYAALKKLDKLGELLFDLPTLVEDLIKLFIKTRSVTNIYTAQILRTLFVDFPSADSTVRLVLLLTVFLSDNCLAHTTPATLRNKLDPLGLLPLTRQDIFNVLTNPFVERSTPILEFAKAEVGLGSKDILDLVEEVAITCLEIGCKGKMLRRLCESYPFLHNTISTVVMQKYHISLDDLPPPQDEKSCNAYEAKLCRDFLALKFAEEMQMQTGDAGRDPVQADGHGDEENETEEHGGVLESRAELRSEHALELGCIGQETLTTMIRQDEMPPSRTRRRNYYQYSIYHDGVGKLQYPNDSVQVGRWIKSEFGVRSDVTSVFFTHAVINNNNSLIQHYLGHSDSHQWTNARVPITLKYFQMMARLGRAPSAFLFQEIESGAEFYASEADCCYSWRSGESRKHKTRIKAENTQSGIPMVLPIPRPPDGSSRSRPRPRRIAAETVRSYAVPDSDDEAILDGQSDIARLKGLSKKIRVESSLQCWIRHLSALLKDEQQKYKEKKKRMEKSPHPDTRIRSMKSDFYKSLAANLRNLRKLDQEKRLVLYGPEVEDDDYTDGDDDEFLYRSRGKRRKLC